MMPQKVPAEHAEAYSEMIEQFHLGSLKLLVDANKITIFRDLPHGYQVNAFTAGLLVSCMIALLTSVRQDKVDETMEQFVEAIKYARKQAESMLREDGT